MIESTESTEDINRQAIAVLYHANCLDGFGAAYAAWCKLGDTADYIPVQYGEAPPLGMDGKRIYILDFSYPIVQMVELIARSAGVLLLDHHKTALPILREVDELVSDAYAFKYTFDITKSGAVLAWEYFNPTEPVPGLLLYIQDRDLWQFKLPYTKEVCIALKSSLHAVNTTVLVNVESFKKWHTIVNSGAAVHGLYSTGLILLTDFNERCARLADKAYKCRIQSHLLYVPNDESDEARARDGLAVNAPAEYASDVGSLLAIKSGTYGAVWTYWGAGKYQVSLRSVGDFDVSEIAKYYGGGGHRNAAGFIVDRSKGQKLRLILQDLTYESR